MLSLAAVQVSQLLEVAGVALVSGVAVTAAFSLVVLSSARSEVARREGRTGAASGFAGLAILALAIFLAVVGFGVHIMLSKG